MKELIYTAIFAGLGVLLIILLWWMFSSENGTKEEAKETLYVPGVYASSIQFNDSAFEVEVIVDENHIHLYEQTEMAAAISKEAILGGLELRTIESHHIDLEDYYMNLIGGVHFE